MGGDTCHMCGERQRERYDSTDRRFRKDGTEKKPTRYESVTYRCGTFVKRDKTGAWIVDVKGDDCIA